MCYRLYIKLRGRWQTVGFSHMSAHEARNEARRDWGGFPYLIMAE